MSKHAPALSIHHIGGRDGSRSFPILPAFEADIFNVIYEADQASVAQIESRNRGLNSRLRVLPYCVGRAAGPVQLNLNYDPYTSSLLPTNPAYAGFYSPEREFDYLWGEVTRSVRQSELNAVTLDQVFAGGFDCPPPDFLSIDTQGSEFDILIGAQETLRQNVLALFVEVEFHPLYLGQKLFGDTCELLARLGYHFVGLHEPFVMAPFRGPVGFRGDGFQVSSNALFLRKATALPGAPATAARNLMLEKLAFFSIVFNQVEYGLQCLLALDSGPESAARSGRPAAYQAFLREFLALYRREPQAYRQTFTEHYTFERSAARFVDQPDAPGASAVATPPAAGRSTVAKEFLRKRLPWLYAFLWASRNAYRFARQNPGGSLPANQPGSPVEQLFERYGLSRHAALLAARRQVP